MTTERDTATRIVLSWLREDAHENAERLLLRALDEVDTTPQRRSGWPAWRFPMNTQARVLIAAAAAVVVAVVGYQLLPRTSSVGPVGPTPTPTVTPSATPLQTPRPTAAAVVPPAGDLAIGRHDLNLAGEHMTFAITKPGWTSNGIFGFDKPADHAGFIVWEDDADGVFADPCTSTKAPPAGPTALDMANAIAGMSSIELVAGPEPFTIGGKPAQMVMVRMPDPLPCRNDQFYLWYDNKIPDNARYASAPGNTVRVWIIEVDGKRIQLDGEYEAGSPAAVGDELWAIVNSLQFD
jgi:hypothetical protein